MAEPRGRRSSGEERAVVLSDGIPSFSSVSRSLERFRSGNSKTTDQEAVGNYPAYLDFKEELRKLGSQHSDHVPLASRFSDVGGA